jgi:hypothetical protein
LVQNKLAAVAVFHTSLAFAAIGFGERALMDHCSEDPVIQYDAKKLEPYRDFDCVLRSQVLLEQFLQVFAFSHIPAKLEQP